MKANLTTACIIVCIFLVSCSQSISDASEETMVTKSDPVRIFNDLQTDTDKTSIPIEEILDGGPGKDGIPSIDAPIFVSIDNEVNEYLSDSSQGILVHIGEMKRWYSYNILNWHEIVNDSIDDTYFAVTFCPLCGSAIVYDRDISSGVTTFGVSGKLYNSNLLMYDRDSETLWSQSRGEAVVGEKLGEKLDIIDADMISWGELQEFHPDADVLSTTGATRRYDIASPYGSYDTNEQLYFPVANVPEASLPLKEMLYVSNTSDGYSVAFVLSDLREQKLASLDVGKKRYTAIYENGTYAIEQDGHFVLPGYFEMWFSWAVKQEGELYLWDGDSE